MRLHGLRNLQNKDALDGQESALGEDSYVAAFAPTGVIGSRREPERATPRR